MNDTIIGYSKREVLECTDGCVSSAIHQYGSPFSRPDMYRTRDWLPPEQIVYLYSYDDVVLDGRFRCLYRENGHIPASRYLADIDTVDASLPANGQIVTLPNDRIYIVACNELHENFFHWMTQCLPAIDVMIRQIGGERFSLALPPLLSWQASSLELLGHNNLEIVTIFPDKFYYLSRSKHTNILTGSTAFSRSRLVDRTYLPYRPRRGVGVSGSKIYVSREDAPHRKMINEVDLIDHLTKIGFDIIRCSELSLKEQASRFNGADLIVAPHGAGMSNIVFCRPGVFVYELASSYYPNNCFQSLALQANLLYWADYFDEQRDNGEPVHMRDWASSTLMVIERIKEIEGFMASEHHDLAVRDCEKRSELLHIAPWMRLVPSSGSEETYIIRTRWGTLVEYDEVHRRLIHRRTLGNLSNIRALKTPRGFMFFVFRFDGSSFALRLPAKCEDQDLRCVDPQRLVSNPQTFALHYIEDQETKVAFNCGGLYLSAEKEGRVTLSRKTLGSWEMFCLEPLSPRSDVGNRPSRASLIRVNHTVGETTAMEKSDVVLAVGLGYTESQLAPFVESIGESAPLSEVVLFAGPEGRSFFSKSKNVLMVDAADYLDAFQDCGQRVDTARYFLYKRYLNRSGFKHRRVLLSDSRDVLLQSDPFSSLPIEKAAFCTLEDRTIKSCSYNSDWIRAAYGARVLESIEDNYISCSGTTIGATDAITAYCNIMCEELIACNRKFSTRDIVGVDQGIHNYIVHCLRPKFLYEVVNHDLVSTLHYTPEGSIWWKSGYIVVHDHAAPIVHQYDRHPRIAQLVASRFFSSAEVHLIANVEDTHK